MTGADRLFVFAIPLVPMRRARDWAIVLDNLQATLRSMLNQLDRNFLVLIASEDVIPLPEAAHPQVHILDVPPAGRLEFDREDYVRGNQDAGIKRALLVAKARALSASFVMVADADDLVSNRITGLVRAMNPAIGCVIRHGLVMDHATGKVAECPGPLVQVPGFDAYCGTSIIYALNPRPMIADDWPMSHVRMGHLNVRTALLENGTPMDDAGDCLAVYVLNSGQNISHSPHNNTGARPFNQQVTENIETYGRPMTQAELKEFGLWN